MITALVCAVALLRLGAWTTPVSAHDAVPRAGEFWCIKATTGDRADPFPARRFVPATILDVRSGWVRYSDNGLRDDVRLSLRDFTAVYTRCAEQVLKPQPRQ